MVFMGRGFTSGGQKSGSAFGAAVCPTLRQRSATLSPYHF